MSRVLKWELEMTDAPQEIGGGKVVLVASQNGLNLVIWTLEPDDDGIPKRFVVIRGTGHEVVPNLVHIGSAITQAGMFVWHVFEEVRF